MSKTDSLRDVLIAGAWRPAKASGSFQSVNPRAKEPLADQYPISTWADYDEALSAAAKAADELRRIGPERIAQFLDRLGERIQARATELVDIAHRETALPKTPRLADVELPRTVNQLKAAAEAAREGSWSMATIDTKLGIRSCFLPLGPVAVFGPNNFPFAFGSVSGGDFAAAIAAGNPVIGKANSSHPGTTRIFAEEARLALDETGLPAATVQLIYRLAHADGHRLVADERIGATAYTGSRSAGLELKAAADRVGKPIYLELSSINPVVILPGALAERAPAVAEEFTTSALMGTGQFCTNPGVVLLLAGKLTDEFVSDIARRFDAAAVGTLLSASVAEKLSESVDQLEKSGAKRVTSRGKSGEGFCHANTLLTVSAKQFLANVEALQTEAFGNASLFIVADNVNQAAEVLEQFEGNLTGTIYSHTAREDDSLYDRLEPVLRRRVGRLLNDKMPTGVAVSPAMNHGGPYPATGHPGFTAVGIPASLHRFAMLACYDQVRQERLPPALRDANPNGKMWRLIDGQWTRSSVGG